MAGWLAGHVRFAGGFTRAGGVDAIFVGGFVIFSPACGDDQTLLAQDQCDRARLE